MRPTRQYLINLTNHLIGKNRYDELFKFINNPDKFIGHAKIALEYGDVHDMSPETLGKIMCAFEIGDVMATKKELFDEILFNGSCEDFLREFVSLCLAYFIRDRLTGECKPKWERSCKTR